MACYDAIVVGTGGVGSACLMHLAARGLKVLGIDRFPPGHNRGSSHGQTRIIRQAYFEHPDYVPLVLRASQLWADLAARRSERLFEPVGLLQIGPPEGSVLTGLRASAQRFGLKLESLSAREIVHRWPGFAVSEPLAGLYESAAGYLRVERCVIAHAEEAVRQSAELVIGEPVCDWSVEGSSVLVRTDRRSFETRRLVFTLGAWAPPLLAPLGIELSVLRKQQLWYAAAPDAYQAAAASHPDGYPAFLFEIPSGIFYGFPQIAPGELKVAEHTGGQVVADPASVNRQVEPADRDSVEEFIAQHLPNLSRTLVRHEVCLYTMSPDAHFIVDSLPEYPQVVFAAGLSGHGFKFAPVLGEALADLACEGQTSLPIDFLGLKRPGLQRQG